MIAPVAGRARCAGWLGLTLVLVIGRTWGAQAMSQPQLIWTRTHDGADHSFDRAMQVAIDRQGHVLVAGGDRNDTDGSWRGIVRKYTPGGQAEWDAGLDGVLAAAIASDPDNQVLVAGFGPPPAPAWQVSKYSPRGRLLWSRSSGSTSGWSGNPYGIATDARGRIVAAGFLRRPLAAQFADWFLIAYGSDGSIRWECSDPAG